VVGRRGQPPGKARLGGEVGGEGEQNVGAREIHGRLTFRARCINGGINGGRREMPGVEMRE
jgi:hypothetical protein